MTLREFTGRSQPASVLRSSRSGLALDRDSSSLSAGRSAGGRSAQGLRELISTRSREASLRALSGSPAASRTPGGSILDAGARGGALTMRRAGRSVGGSQAISATAARIPSVNQALALPANRSVSSSIIRSDWSHALAEARFFDHHHDRFGHHFFGHHHDHFFFGFRFGIFIGYPYFSYPYYSYPYYSYPYCWPWDSLYVAYPYNGYYGYYNYPYLADYGCDFYDGFYLRFGPARVSYYSACSSLGYHRYPYHHMHSYSCGVHGMHYYHVRDCPQCYPAGESYYEYQSTDVNPPYQEPAAPAEGEPAPPEEPAPEQPLNRGATPESAAAAPETVEPAPASVEVDPLAGLSPAKLTFALGLLTFEKGGYDEAADDFFNASIEDPESGVVKLFLAVSLVAISEHDYAAYFLRRALAGDGDLARHPLNLARFYGEGRGEDLQQHRALLAERAELFPADANAQLLRGYFALNTGDLEQAGVSLDAFRQVAASDEDRTLADRLLAEVLARKGIEPPSRPAVEEAAIVQGTGGGAAQESDAIDDFLADPRLEAVRALPMR